MTTTENLRYVQNDYDSHNICHRCRRAADKHGLIYMCMRSSMQQLYCAEVFSDADDPCLDQLSVFYA